MAIGSISSANTAKPVPLIEKVVQDSQIDSVNEAVKRDLPAAVVSIGTISGVNRDREIVKPPRYVGPPIQVTPGKEDPSYLGPPIQAAPDKKDPLYLGPPIQVSPAKEDSLYLGPPIRIASFVEPIQKGSLRIKAKA